MSGQEAVTLPSIEISMLVCDNIVCAFGYQDYVLGSIESALRKRYDMMYFVSVGE